MLKNLAVAAIALSLIAPAAPAIAADRIAIQVGYSPGGSYDAMARLVADHLGRHLPDAPDIVVENVPGAGSMKLARLLMATGAADGSQIASVSSALALAPVFDPGNDDFDPRQARYLAAMSSEPSYCVAHKSSGIESFEALLQSDAKVGATGKRSSTYIYPAAIKAAFGAGFEVITGFQGGSEINLAMERGDVQARCGIGVTTLLTGDVLERYNVIGELATVPQGRFEGAAFVLDLVEDEARRAALSLVFSSTRIHHPMIVAPGTPDAIVEDLRAAFAAMAADPAFQADGEARSIFASFTPGAEVEATIAALAATDPAIQAMARDFVR